MEKYDYRQGMIEDIKNYIKNNPQQAADPFITDDIENYWYDLLWAEDCITGNGANWYASEEECEEMIAHNLELALETLEEFGLPTKAVVDSIVRGHAAQYIDCTIRCYLLGECLHQALEELNDG